MAPSLAVASSGSETWWHLHRQQDRTFTGSRTFSTFTGSTFSTVASSGSERGGTFTVAHAQVAFESYDQGNHGENTMAKAVLDALKVATTGRRDGRTIYYFGAIVDDNSSDLAGLTIHQHVVEAPEDVGCRILVRGAPDGAIRGA